MRRCIAAGRLGVPGRVFGAPFGLCRPTALLPRCCAASASSPGPTSSPAVARAPGAALGVPRGASLAELSQRGGLIPKPETFDERLKPGFRGGRALFIFFLLNVTPFGCLMYYLREEREKRAALSMPALPSSAPDVAAEALRVIRTTPVCFFIQEGAPGTKDALARGVGALRVDPHLPEGSAYVPQTEPLPLVPALERNDVTDLFESPPSPGLGFIHFALSRSSPTGVSILAGHRNASLLYSSPTRAAYCTVSGQLSVLSDPESRRHYWKSVWSWAFLPTEPPAASPHANPPSPDEAPPAWTQKDFMLLRLSVDEVTLHAMVDGPQRWENRRVKAVKDLAEKERGLQWTLAA